MTLQPKCEDVETAEGVAITVTGVAQVNHHTFLGMPVQTPPTHPTHLPPYTPSSTPSLWHHPIITVQADTEGSNEDAHLVILMKTLQ